MTLKQPQQEQEASYHPSARLEIKNHEERNKRGDIKDKGLPPPQQQQEAPAEVKTLHLKNLPSGERRVIHLRLYLNKYNVDGALAPSEPGDLQHSVSLLLRINQPPCLIPHYAA